MVAIPEMPVQDGMNWDLMNDGVGNPKNCKSLLYSHVTPRNMISGIRESAEVAVRAGFKHIQFYDISEQDAVLVDEYLKIFASCSQSLSDRWRAISQSKRRAKSI